MNLRKKLMAICIVFVFSLGGCFAAYWLFGQYAEGKFLRWISLGTPPGKAVQVEGLYAHWQERVVDVYVQTSSGKIRWYSAKDGGNWEETSLPQSNLYWGSCDRLPDTTLTPFFGNLPEKVIDCKAMLWQWEWFTEETFVVILEDGSVWQWHHDTGYDRLGAFLCGGMAVGALSGATLSAVILRKRGIADELRNK